MDDWLSPCMYTQPVSVKWNKVDVPGKRWWGIVVVTQRPSQLHKLALGPPVAQNVTENSYQKIQ